MNQVSSADSEETVAVVLTRTTAARSWLAGASAVGSVSSYTNGAVRFRLTGDPQHPILWHPDEVLALANWTRARVSGGVSVDTGGFVGQLPDHGTLPALANHY